MRGDDGEPMIERLQRALEHIEELPEEAQGALAEQIERLSQEQSGVRRKRNLAGVWGDLPDDMEEILLRWRRETPVTPPIDEEPREEGRK